jgi:hypothetical protein
MGETKLADLRSKTTQNAERTRRLERIRGIVALNAEIGQHQQVLDTSATLERERQQLAEMIGAIAATDEAVIHPKLLSVILAIEEERDVLGTF